MRWADIVYNNRVRNRRLLVVVGCSRIGDVSAELSCLERDLGAYNRGVVWLFIVFLI